MKSKHIRRIAMLLLGGAAFLAGCATNNPDHTAAGGVGPSPVYMGPNGSAGPGNPLAIGGDSNMTH